MDDRDCSFTCSVWQENRTFSIGWDKTEKLPKICISRSSFMAEGHRLGLSISWILLILSPQKRKQTKRRDGEPYRSFISMDMTSKDYINFVKNEPTLKGCSHAFTLHEVRFITIVDWHMHKHNKPGCLLPVHPFEFFSKPQPLRCVCHCWKGSTILI